MLKAENENKQGERCECVLSSFHGKQIIFNVAAQPLSNLLYAQSCGYCHQCYNENYWERRYFG